MKILMISGTYNRQSRTWLMLEEARKHCDTYDVETEIVELCDYAITVGQKDTSHQISELVEKINESEAIIFSTPNYQGSISGLLKVAIDHIPERGLKNKSVGLISVSGGIGNMSQPLSHLRDIVSSLEGLAVATNIACHSDDFIRDDEGKSSISNEKILERVKDMVEELYRHTK